MHVRSSSSRARALVAIAAVSLTWGLAFAPQVALAEEDVTQEGVEQEAVSLIDNEEEAVVEEQGSDSTAVAPTSTETETEQKAAATSTEDTTETVVSEGEPTEEVTETENVEATENPVAEGTTATEEEAVATTEVAETEGEASEAVTEGEVTEAEESETTEATETEATETESAETEAATETLAVAATEDEALSTQGSPIYQEVAEGTYYIESGIAASDGLGLARLVLDARGSAKEGTDVITWTYKGGDNQKWIVMRSAPGSDWYNIASYANPSLYLTAVANSKLYLTKYVSGSASQLWAFLLSSTSYGTGYKMVSQGVQKSVKDSTITATYQNKVADVKGGKPVKGSDVILYSKGADTKPNQCFYLAKATPDTVTGGAQDLEGRYSVRVPGTYIVAEARGAKTANGTNISVYTGKGGAHQNLYLQHEGNGFYSVWVMGTKKVLDVASSCILPGTNVIQWSYTKGKTNQQWSVVKNSNGTWTLINRATGLALGGASEKNGNYGSGTNLAGAQNNGRTNNTFTFKRFALLSAGIYKFTKTSNGAVVDVSGSSTKSGAAIGFYKDKGNKNNNLNQRFELVSAGGTDQWRIRTASSGGWITVNSSNKIVQNGNHATAKAANNTWIVTWNNGNYQFTCASNGRYLGGASANYKMTKAPIYYSGLFEINSNAASVVLDNPGSSKVSGKSYGVYRANNGANQKFRIEKSGTGFKITNVASGMVLTGNNQYVVQKKYSGSSTQIWTFGIADGGAVRIINSSTGRALDIYGNGSVSTSGSTAARAYPVDSNREARQGWKLEATDGFYTSGGTRYYIRSDGSTMTVSNACYAAYKSVQSKSSSSKYIMVIDNSNYRTFVFTGSKGNWTPYADWAATVGTANGGDDTFGETFRGISKVRKKGYMMGQCPYEFYWTEFYINSAALNSDGEGQRFHSILYWGASPNSSVYDGTLGAAASHGCVRLATANAKWVYNNVPIGTTVWSY